MKTHSIASIWILALTLPSFADTFVMKDGTTLEGVVLREDPTNYVVEVKVTKSIKDERVIPKADVTKIEREQLDLTAFQEIAKLVPVPDLTTVDEYGQRVRAVDKFLAEHRGSSKSKEAKAILATLKAESAEIVAGAIKMNGKVVSPSEYRSNAYDIDARIQEAKIRALIKSGRHLAALRAFSDFSRDFRNTSAHASILPLISQVITSYMGEIEQSLATYDARVKERDLGLSRMSSADRSGTENAIREEMAELEARLKAEKEAKVSWVSTHPFLKASLEETITFGKQEIARLDSMKSAPSIDAGKAYRDVLTTIQGKGDTASVTTALTAAKTALVAPKYIAILEASARSSGAIK